MLYALTIIFTVALLCSGHCIHGAVVLIVGVAVSVGMEWLDARRGTPRTGRTHEND